MFSLGARWNLALPSHICTDIVHSVRQNFDNKANNVLFDLISNIMLQISKGYSMQIKEEIYD